MERVPDGLGWWGLLLLVYLDHVEDLFSPTSVAQARYGTSCYRYSPDLIIHTSTRFSYLPASLCCMMVLYVLTQWCEQTLYLQLGSVATD